MRAAGAVVSAAIICFFVGLLGYLLGYRKGRVIGARDEAVAHLAAVTQFVHELNRITLTAQPPRKDDRHVN